MFCPLEKSRLRAARARGESLRKMDKTLVSKLTQEIEMGAGDEKPSVRRGVWEQSNRIGVREILTSVRHGRDFGRFI